MILLALGMTTSASAHDSDLLARFDGGIGVQPVANVAGPANPDGTFPNVRLNTVRGVNPAGPWTRIADGSMPPRIKCSANYQNGRLATMEAKANGYDGALLLNTRGKLAEAPGACCFLTRAGVPITPPVTADILESVTRTTLLELFRTELGQPPVDRAESFQYTLTTLGRLIDPDQRWHPALAIRPGGRVATAAVLVGGAEPIRRELFVHLRVLSRIKIANDNKGTFFAQYHWSRAAPETFVVAAMNVHRSGRVQADDVECFGANGNFNCLQTATSFSVSPVFFQRDSRKDIDGVQALTLHSSAIGIRGKKW